MSSVTERLDQYDVVLDGPSLDDRGAIPLGNGVLCASVWVTAAGIAGYLSRSDALTELDRTVKLCGFRIDFAQPVFAAATVTQRLHLRDGILRVHAGDDLELEIFVDGRRDVFFVSGRGRLPMDLSARLSTWRTEPNTAARACGLYEVTDRDSWIPPEGFPHVVESPDELLELRTGVAARHVNGRTIIPPLAAHHGLAAHVGSLPDLLTGRVFGAFLTSPDEPEIRDGALNLAAATSFDFRIATRSTQLESPADWIKAIERDANGADSTAEARARTQHRWNDYWARSWVDVQGDRPVSASATDAVTLAAAGSLPPASPGRSSVTRAYVLTKWMTACAAGGPLPILYNGSLFTLMPGAGLHLSLDNFAVAFTAPPRNLPTIELNPDERSWTVENLWQNLRLPYHSMLARGEENQIRPMFAYYRRFWELNRIRARVHHGAVTGQWNTEMTLTFGLQSPAVYGTDREGLSDGHAVNRWGGAVDLSPGLELVDMMFDYYWFSRDAAFLADELLPYAEDLVAFIVDRYSSGQHGRLAIGPINTLETYWDTINPVTVVAGLHALDQDLARLEPGTLKRYPSLRQLNQALPGLPLHQSDGSFVIAPADIYLEERKNVESPELYPIFPFRVHESQPVEIVRRTLINCIKKAGMHRPAVLGEPVGTPSFSGWQYLGPVCALVGDTERAAEILSSNAALSNPGYRFPAMWGPIYDAVPDVDHGANILNTVQLMLMQVSDREIRLLPAWPRDWDVSFRLFADATTSVEVEYVGGAVRRLTVEPTARLRDVSLPGWATPGT